MITNKELAARLRALMELEGRPLTGPGSLSIETWSPGDGWTRYRLVEELGGGSANDSAYYGRGDFVAYLAGRIDGVRRKRRVRAEPCFTFPIFEPPIN